MGGHREQLDKVFGPMHLESFSVSVNCNMWHDLAAVWPCPRNIMIIKRLSIRISLSPALIPLLRLQPHYRNHGQESWYSSIKTQSRLSVLSTVALCILTWHGVALPHSPRTNLLTPCRAVSTQVLSYSSNSCSLDFKASKSRVKGETISYNEEKAICNRRVHGDVLQLLWYYINELNHRCSAHNLVTNSLSYPSSYLFFALQQPCTKY